MIRTCAGTGSAFASARRDTAMRKAPVLILLSVMLVACGGAAPTPDISAIQTQAAEDAIATLTAQTPTATEETTEIPIPTDTPTATPTDIPTATPTDTPIPAPTHTPTPIPPPTATKPIERHGSVGQRVESGGWALTVHSVAREATEDQSALPPKPMVLVSIELTLENATGDYLEHTWLSYFIVDNEGQVFAPDVLSTSHSFLFVKSLGGGQRINGSMGFAVSPDATSLTLVYQPFVGQRAFPPMRISLD